MQRLASLIRRIEGRNPLTQVTPNHQQGGAPAYAALFSQALSRGRPHPSDADLRPAPLGASPALGYGLRDILGNHQPKIRLIGAVFFVQAWSKKRKKKIPLAQMRLQPVIPFALHLTN